jgi:hypothetical protein
MKEKRVLDDGRFSDMGDGGGGETKERKKLRKK